MKSCYICGNPKYFHVTPVSRLKPILSKGLITRAKPTMRIKGREETTGKVFITDDVSDIIDQIHLGQMSGGHAHKKRTYVILLVDIPSNVKIYQDNSGYDYIKRPISAKRIKVIRYFRYPGDWDKNVIERLSRWSKRRLRGLN